MKFQKTAIAVTIAGFASLPMMASADTVLSGVVQVKVQGSDEEAPDPVDDPATVGVDESLAPAGDDPGEFSFAAGDVRVGIASEHELKSGLIGYGNLQFNIDDLTGEGGGAEGSFDVDGDGSITDEENINLDASATVSSDNVYVGIKGGFGDVRWGEIPLAVEYGQLANDIHDVGQTVEDGLSYTGSFGIFGLGLNYSPAKGEDDDTAATNSDMFGAGVKFNFAGATIGLGFEDRDEGVNVAVGASYAIAGVSLAVHYWAQETDFSPDVVIDTEDPEDDNLQTEGFDIDDTTNFAVQAGYSIAGVALGLTYSVLEVDDDIPDGGDQSVIRFDAGYDLGGGMDVSTRIQSITDEDDGDETDDKVEYRVMLTKAF